MANQLYEQLMQSFNELDDCINRTKQSLSNRIGVPREVLQRVDTYGEILLKQKALALGLKSQIEVKNWDEAARHIKIINALSGMIKEDAQAVLLGTGRVEDSAYAGTYLC